MMSFGLLSFLNEITLGQYLINTKCRYGERGAAAAGAVLKPSGGNYAALDSKRLFCFLDVRKATSSTLLLNNSIYNLKKKFFWL